jgi:hypothetical protein
MALGAVIGSIDRDHVPSRSPANAGRWFWVVDQCESPISETISSIVQTRPVIPATIAGVLPPLLRAVGELLPMGLLAGAGGGLLQGTADQRVGALGGLALYTLGFTALAARFFRTA